jgi:hypothetical protein
LRLIGVALISIVYAVVGFTVGHSTEPQLVGVFPHNAAI